jgi:circadian clock protein KaiC
MEFLIRGVSEFKEPGLFVSFEESEEELAQNIASLGFNIKDLIEKNQLILNHIQIDRTEFTEIGSYNLDGLFIQLEHLIDKFKIKRVVLDTLEVLFSNLKNESILRSELQRLFHWFKSKKVTVLITAEKGINTLTRYGLEEYVADCVITLDNRIEQQISTRRIRIAKYRGTSHGNNEYPFIITTRGIHIISITSLRLEYKSSTKRISSGIKQLDTMLNEKGFYCGSSILVSGPAGIGKSSIAAAFANGVCERGEKCLYFAFEESIDQIIRNMNSIGIHLEKWVKKGLLKFSATNPNSSGLETHLAYIQNEVDHFKPDVTIIDPITNLKVVGNTEEVHDMLSILIAYFKSKEITVMFLNLVSGEALIDTARTIEGISSLMDTWIFLQYLTGDGERSRLLSIIKSRGMPHSNQFREVHISNKGINLHEVYVGEGKVLTGAARLIQSSEKEIENANIRSKIKQKERKAEVTRKEIENKINLLMVLLENAKDEKLILAEQVKRINTIIDNNRAEISKIRMADKYFNKKLTAKRVKNGKSKKISKKEK